MPGTSETAMIVVLHTASGTRYHSAMSPTSSRPLLDRTLDIDKINFVAARDHDVIHPSEHDEPASLPRAEVLGA